METNIAESLGINVDKLNAISQPTPFLAIDLEKVRQNYLRLARLLPGFTVYYAMKSNPEAPILQTLKKEGCRFEIASIGELRRLQQEGVNPAEVIFSNPVKIAEHIKLAYEAGVNNFAVDSLPEVVKISQNAPGAEVYARIAVSNHGSIINLSNKFGVQAEEVVELMVQAKQRGLVPSGISFHVGSQAENVLLWDAAIEQTGQLIEELKEVNIDIRTVNVGGGIPIMYTEPVPGMEDITSRIMESISKFIPSDVQLACEPGRALVGDAGVIAASIIGLAERQDQEWLYLDTGRFQSFIEMFESDELKYPVLTAHAESDDENRKTVTLTGPTCDSYDTIMQDVSLPAGSQLNDRLYFGSAGAYTHVYGAPFNDFPVPTVIFERFIDVAIDIE